MVQEIGHLADLWAHSSDPNNVMTDRSGGTADQITSFQCCMLRTSRFSSALPCLRVPRPDLSRESAPSPPAPRPSRPDAEPRATPGIVSHAFQRMRGPEPSARGLSASGAAQAAVALAVSMWWVRRLLRAVRR